jgi:hypothetical protein
VSKTIIKPEGIFHSFIQKIVYTSLDLHKQKKKEKERKGEKTKFEHIHYLLSAKPSLVIFQNYHPSG